MIRNFNTYEEFKEYDRSAHMERAGRMVCIRFLRESANADLKDLGCYQ